MVKIVFTPISRWLTTIISQTLIVIYWINVKLSNMYILCKRNIFLFPTVGVLQLKHQAPSWPFVILLLKPLRSFFFFFWIYFNYLVLVFYIPQRVTYCHHYFDILLSLFYLLKQVKQFLAPRSNKSEQHNFLKISLIIMHRSWEYREKVDDPKQNRHRSVF